MLLRGSREGEDMDGEMEGGRTWTVTGTRDTVRWHRQEWTDRAEKVWMREGEGLGGCR